MSELINTSDNRTTIRWKLLTGVSAFALVACSSGIARAEDSSHPVLWLEFGGQAERVGDAPEILAPPFFNNTSAADLAPMLKAQRPSPFSLGEEGKISFEPGNTDWVLSLAIRYGKSSATRHVHHQTPADYVYQYFGTQILPQPADQQFGDGQGRLSESHLILDFEAGKDVGLGMFGVKGSSVISIGVRFAQFTSRANVSVHARPHYTEGAAHSGTRVLTRYVSSPIPSTYYITAGYRTVDLFRSTFAATLHAKRKTNAVGPAVTWSASLPVAGNDADMTLNFDWGVNAALLFGRQRTRTEHKTSGSHYSKTGGKFKYHYTPGGYYTRGNTIRTSSYVHGPVTRTRSRRVTIPNLGGFAGISLKFPNAKVSLGYRADVFFGAVDGGIDVRKSQNRAFYGPYASISIGLGD